MAAEEVPEYLKSLEEMLARVDETATVTEQATEAPTDLSSIGFGSMFTTPKKESKKSLRFMLVSTHVHQYTGYSKVSYGILSELAKHSWLDLTHFETSVSGVSGLHDHGGDESAQ